MNSTPPFDAASSLPTGPCLLAPELPPTPAALRQAITDAWLKDEAGHVRELLEQARLPAAEQAQIQATAADLVRRVRARASNQGAIEASCASTTWAARKACC